MTLLLRHMRLSDIQDIIAIERRSFSTPWPARSYAYEIAESPYSYMTVLQRVNAESTESGRGVPGFLKNIMRTAPSQGAILGYGGLWKIMDEAHISTIASHPDARGSGYGELLLAAMVRKSIELEARYVVLEVRVSNTVAQNLYKKYGFEIYATKPRYYQDDGEDAFDMRLDIAKQAVVERVASLWGTLRERFAFTDSYTETERPRSGDRD